VPQPGIVTAESTRIAGRFLRDVMKANAERRNFRVMGPDETASNRLDALFEVTDRVSTAEIRPCDDHVSPDGRVMEVLSEHLCQGWLEGYLFSGRHGFFPCYEASIHIVDSMFNQHARTHRRRSARSQGLAVARLRNAGSRGLIPAVTPVKTIQFSPSHPLY
jgi:xylulose-5-phosphate/fructose-6-phosphate phosphoketolase